MVSEWQPRAYNQIVWQTCLGKKALHLFGQISFTNMYAERNGEYAGLSGNHLSIPVNFIQHKTTK